MRVPLFVLLVMFAACAFAQNAAVPEVRGGFFESGATTPIPGVTVTLYEFGPDANNFITKKPVVSTLTDSNGAYMLRPDHFGSFILEAQKDGYTALTGYQFALSAAAPAQNFRLSLVRPGTLSGRVIDQNGNPVRDLRLLVERTVPRGSSFAPGSLSIQATTDPEGIFTAANLQPGPYWVHIVPKPARDVDALIPYTDEAFKIVDEDVEPSFWPGGVPKAEMVLPITVSGGAISNAGTITIRKVPYYRVRISLNRDCEPNERWIFRLRLADTRTPSLDRYADCRRDSLLTSVPPGDYDLAVWRGRDIDRWARASVVVGEENTSTTISFAETASVSGRLIAAENADLAKLGRALISLGSSEALPNGNPIASWQATGEFTFARVPWTAQWLSVQPTNPDTYVKEIRYNGLPQRGPDLDAIPGAKIDVVLDSQAAGLSVQFKSGDKPATGRLMLFSAAITEPPKLLAAFPPFVIMGGESLSPAPSKISSIPPGEYRMLALSLFSNEDFSDPNYIAQRFAQAPKITLGRGEQKSIEVQLK